MNIHGQAALVTGGASGLGAQTARELARRGAKVAVLDRNGDGAQARRRPRSAASASAATSPRPTACAALDAARAAHGPARLLMNIAGIGTAKRLIGRDGTPMPLEDFERVIEINLVGTFNMIRLAAAEMVKLDPLDDGERGVIVCTASVAAFDGQVGQEAYAASKGGVVALTLPLARDLAQFGVRVVHDRAGPLPDAADGRAAAAGAGIAGREHPVPEAAGQTRRVRAARCAASSRTWR